MKVIYIPSSIMIKFLSVLMLQLCVNNNVVVNAFVINNTSSSPHMRGHSSVFWRTMTTTSLFDSKIPFFSSSKDDNDDRNNDDLQAVNDLVKEISIEDEEWGIEDYENNGYNNVVTVTLKNGKKFLAAFYTYSSLDLVRKDSKMWNEAKDLLEVIRQEEMYEEEEEEDSSTETTSTTTTSVQELKEESKTTVDMIREKPTHATEQLLIDYDDEEGEEEDEEDGDTRFAADEGEGVTGRASGTNNRVDDSEYGVAIVAVA